MWVSTQQKPLSRKTCNLQLKQFTPPIWAQPLSYSSLLYYLQTPSDLSLNLFLPIAFHSCGVVHIFYISLIMKNFFYCGRIAFPSLLIILSLHFINLPCLMQNSAKWRYKMQSNIDHTHQLSLILANLIKIFFH